jgi:bifunctional non-homologous end joining protein LigD
MPITQSVNLAYRQGSSDKVYNVWIESTPRGFYDVKFSYGKRGSTLKSDAKASAVSQRRAQEVLDAIVSEKTGKGYRRVTTAAGGSPTEPIHQGIVMTPVEAQKKLGILPQLLNPIDESKLEQYFTSDDWYMQEKKDGNNFMAQKKDGVVETGNRRGLVVGCPAELDADLKKLKINSFQIYGEICGSKMYVFDMTELNGVDLKGRPYYYRFNEIDVLDHEITKQGLTNIEVLETYANEEAKREAFARIKAERGEGVVFKRADAQFSVGRPNSGGDQVKFKFTGSVTCQVAGITEGKRSVALSMRDGGDYKIVGNVTILPNFPVPKIGQLVEVKYLYAYREGSLYQPVYQGERTDIDDFDDISTLKYKQDSDEEDEVCSI